MVLLHGFPQHWWEWRGVLPGLAAHYRVICPDLRGAGWTDAPPTGYTSEQLLADVVALLDALELDQVCLIAHDWGALLGYELCLRAPHRVRKYVSLGVPPPFVRFDPRLLGRGRQRLTYHLLRDFTTNRNTCSENDIELFAASCAHRPAPPPRPLSTAADAHRRRRPHRAPGVPRRMRGAHR
ncbi:alpha/beta fold hydrolase [Rhodococcus jostii]|uniref:alpha/beta fold hydrolase n=1 Tax=Rhodococcus jostii TaxID=132919 RepID=UPI00364648C8